MNLTESKALIPSLLTAWKSKVVRGLFFLETIFVFPVLIYSCLEMYLSTNTFSLMRNLFGIRVR